ncbi:hypothetical protein L1887_11174 [Cichorium endivia]|nr:hypothetical protein L1887_11174 [Cichorium endivia]
MSSSSSSQSLQIVEADKLSPLVLPCFLSSQVEEMAKIAEVAMVQKKLLKHNNLVLVENEYTAMRIYEVLDEFWEMRGDRPYPLFSFSISFSAAVDNFFSLLVSSCCSYVSWWVKVIVVCDHEE